MTDQERSARLGYIGGIGGSLLGFLGGLIGAYFTIKACDDPQERTFLIVATIVIAIAYLVTVALFFLFINKAVRLRNTMMKKIQRGEMPSLSNLRANKPKARAFVIKSALVTFMAWLTVSVVAIYIHKDTPMTAGQWGGLIGGWGGGLWGVWGGVIGTYYSITRTNGPKERRFVIRQAGIVWMVLVFIAGLHGLGYFFFRHNFEAIRPACMMPLFFLFPWIMWSNARQQMIAAEEARGTQPHL